MNKIILAVASNNKDYKENRRATYKQISEAGGQVKKGEKGTTIYFWQFFKDKLDEDKRIPMVKLYTVFNIEQQEGAEFKDEKVFENEEILDAQEIVDWYLTREWIEILYWDPAYTPATDKIKMPNLNDFENSIEYYTTFFHEIVHSTGAEKRLDRPMITEHRSMEYSKEELIAEFGACFIMNTTGTEFELGNHSQYIASWAKRIRTEDKQSELFLAIGKAEKACEYVLNWKKPSKD